MKSFEEIMKNEVEAFNEIVQIAWKHSEHLSEPAEKMAFMTNVLNKAMVWF